MANAYRNVNTSGTAEQAPGIPATQAPPFALPGSASDSLAALDMTGACLLSFDDETGRGAVISGGENLPLGFQTEKNLTQAAINALANPTDRAVLEQLWERAPLFQKKASARVRIRPAGRRVWHWYEVTVSRRGTPPGTRTLALFRDVQREVKHDARAEADARRILKLQGKIQEQESLLAMIRQFVAENYFDYTPKNDTLQLSLTATPGDTRVFSFPDCRRTGVFSRFLHPEDLPDFLLCLEHATVTPGKRAGEYRLRFAEGEYHWARLHCTSVTDAVGRVERLLGRIDDITREVEYHERAKKDELTGLMSRAFCLDTISALIEDRVPGVLIMFDTDNFKRINDTYGHVMGDDVLHILGTTIRACFRESDPVGRFGGDEFLVWMYNVSPNDEVIEQKISEVNERLREALLRHLYPPLTISAGAAYPIAGESFEDLFRRADSALYVAKRNGKSCCSVALPPTTDD